MKNLPGLLPALLLVAFNTGNPAYSADQAIHMGGYLVDETCASSAKFKPNALQYVREHTRECSLEPACSAHGYEVFSDGKWYLLDDKGISLARKLLTSSKTEAGNYVIVDGTLKAGRIIVTQMKEAPAPK